MCGFTPPENVCPHYLEWLRQMAENYAHIRHCPKCQALWRELDETKDIVAYEMLMSNSYLDMITREFEK